jgi:hypothetical protein
MMIRIPRAGGLRAVASDIDVLITATTASGPLLVVAPEMSKGESIAGCNVSKRRAQGS